jgi:hypothetical protein
MRLPNPQRSRGVLIGTGRYTDDKLPDLPVVGRTISDLAAALSDPTHGVIPENHLTVLEDEGDIRLIGRRLRQAASLAEDLFLVYYTGHGLVASRRHELYLGLPDSEWADPEFNSLEYDKLRSMVLDSAAATKVIVLDCCFSGRVVSDTMADPVTEMIGQIEIDGTYVLTSAHRDQVALIMPGEVYTAFTGRFLQLLRNGVPGGPEFLTIEDLYRRLLVMMKAEGLPQPQKRNTRTAELLALARNRAFTAITEPADPSQEHEVLWDMESTDAVAIQIRQIIATHGSEVREDPRLIEALMKDLLIGNRQEIFVLVSAVREGVPSALLTLEESVLTAVQRERLSRRLQDNLRLTEDAATWAVATWASALGVAGTATSAQADGPQPIPVSSARPASTETQARIAQLIDEAVTAAQSIPSQERKAATLSKVATAMAAVDPARAALISQDAKRAAESITEDYPKECRLAEVAETLARIAASIGAAAYPNCPAQLFDEAERFAQSITEYDPNSEALANLAAEIIGVASMGPADSEPSGSFFDQAERVAQSIRDTERKVKTLASLGMALSADPDRSARLLADAERAAQSYSYLPSKASALASLAAALAAADPDYATRLSDDAERAANQTADQAVGKEYVLHKVALAVSATDPDRAVRIARSIVNKNNGYYTALVLARVALVLASTDPDQAERVARSISYEGEYKPRALAGIAAALVSTNPDRAALLFDEAERADQPDNDNMKGRAREYIAKELAAFDPDRALRLARLIEHGRPRTSALAGIATVLATTDPDRAARILADAARAARTITDSHEQALALLALCEIIASLAKTNPS